MTPCNVAGTSTYSKRRWPGKAGQAFAWYGEGCHLMADDGTRYLDFVGGLGPVILGYRNAEVDRAVTAQIALRGVGFSLPTGAEESLAATLCRLIPCAEQVRFLKNGADALEAAVRVARAVTGRDHVLRGGYHGMHDWCVESRGIPLAVRRLQRALPAGILPVALGLPCAVAAVVLEPVVAQTGILPQPGYLQAIRDWCTQEGTLLIFDEVVTGFRCHLGGAQTLFGVTPDLACFSKAMGNGYPISALVGKREYLQTLEQGVFVSTTFGGDPIGLTSAQTTIGILERDDTLTHLGVLGEQLRARLLALAREHGVALTIHGYPQRLVLQFANPDQAIAFNTTVCDAGVLAPGAYNLMAAHLEDPDLLDRLSSLWHRAFAGL